MKEIPALNFRPERVFRVKSEGFQDEEACPGYLGDVPQLNGKLGPDLCPHPRPNHLVIWLETHDT